MALSEFAAMETAYRALQDLDPTARRRAVRWLTDALGVPETLPDEPAAGGEVSEPTGGRRRGRRATQTAAAATPGAPASTGRATRRVSAPKQTRPRRGGRGSTADTASGQDRPYRRMPPADEVLAAYEQTGTVSGLAEHFGVPRHTVQGWARRLRREGHHIGRAG